MIDSILDSTKKNLGIDAAYTPFDPDITVHINAALATLTQLGIGPDEGFAITGSEEKWSDLLADDKRKNLTQSYVYLRVRVLFDPPTTSYLLEAYQKQIQEMEWRLNVVREGDEWILPTQS